MDAYDRDLPEVLDRYIKKFNSATNGTIERHTKESLEWFRKRLSKDLNVPRMKLIKDAADYKKRTGNENSLIGRLYYFHYQAEEAGDKELGVYDEFPMVFIFNSTKNKMGQRVLWGLNLHYATPQQRAVLYTQLLKVKTGGWSSKTKLRLTWNVIKTISSHKLYEKCVHAYRVDRMKSRLIEIDPREWEVATFLQLAKWSRPKGNGVVQSEVRNNFRRRK